MCKFCTCEDGDAVYGKEYDLFGNHMLSSMFMIPEEKRLVSMIGDETVINAKIKYCPMCGEEIKTK